MNKKSEAERLEGVLSLRVPLEIRARLLRDAAARGKKLSEHLFSVLLLGIETDQARLKAEKTTVKDEPAGIPTVEGERLEETQAAEKAVEPQLRGTQPQPAADEFLIDEPFLQALRDKFPELDFQKQMARVDRWLKKNPEKKISRGLLSGFFEVTSRSGLWRD